MPTWKRAFLAAASFGAGFALVLCLAVGFWVWHSSRPKPPKPWDTKAVVAIGPPGFSLSSDGKKIDFLYTLQNTTAVDYQIESQDEIKITVRTREDTLSRPLKAEAASATLPIFIPAKQKTLFELSITPSDIPERKLAESDSDYHERLRKYLEEHLAGVAGFVLFEPSNRYQIDLPRWLAELPKSEKR